MTIATKARCLLHPESMPAGPLTFFDSLKLYVGFTDESSSALRELHPLAAPQFVRIVDDFYAAIEAHPGARAAITGGPAQIARLKQTLTDWLDRMLLGPHDEAYFQRRARIGRVHVQIALPQQYMFTAMNRMRVRLVDVVATAFAGDPKAIRRIETAVAQIMDLELAIMLETYREDLETKNRNAERLATIGQFAASIGHELRNPLGVIESSIYLVRQHLGPEGASEPKVAKHLERIGTEVKRAGQTISDLLDLARNRPTAANPHAAWAADRFGDRGRAAALDGDRRGADRRTASAAEVDPDQMRQVLVNLLANAAQAMRGSGRVVVAASSSPGGGVRLRVRDEGPGVPEDARPRLFEALFTTKAKGSGLGLALCRRILEAHGATIVLEPADPSRPGASFLLELPGGAFLQPSRSRGAMKRSVLIVDDDAALADNLSEIVESLGVETVVAPDRQSALGIAAGRDFDVALIDVRLPDGDGVSLLETLRASCPFIQSVLLTGNATIEGAIAAVRGDAFAYVLKPVSPPDLLDTMTRALYQAALYRDKERLRVELERSEHRHRDLVESVPAFVLALDDAGRIATWNRQLERATGYSREEDAGARRTQRWSGRAWPTASSSPATSPSRREASAKSAGAEPRCRARGNSPASTPSASTSPTRTRSCAGCFARSAWPPSAPWPPGWPTRSAIRSIPPRSSSPCSSGASAAAMRPIPSCPSPASSRARSIASIGWCVTSWPLPNPVPSRPARSTSGSWYAGWPISSRPRPRPPVSACGNELAEPPVFVLGDAERLRQVLLNLTRNAMEAIGTRGGHIALRVRDAGRGRRDRSRRRRPRVRGKPAHFRRVFHDQGTGDRSRPGLGSPHRDRSRGNHSRDLPPRPDLLHRHLAAKALAASRGWPTRPQRSREMGSRADFGALSYSCSLY